MIKHVGKRRDALPSGGHSDNKYKSSTDVLDLGALEVIFWKNWDYG